MIRHQAAITLALMGVAILAYRIADYRAQAMLADRRAELAGVVIIDDLLIACQLGGNKAGFDEHGNFVRCYLRDGVRE